jgi:hypothetical protein
MIWMFLGIFIIAMVLTIALPCPPCVGPTNDSYNHNRRHRGPKP